MIYGLRILICASMAGGNAVMFKVHNLQISYRDSEHMGMASADCWTAQ